MTTPYFVPDEPFLEAMETAALRGVDVHLVVPEHSNKLVTNWAQESHYARLLDSGIHIHLYAPRFLHAKHVTVDRWVAVVGSVNMDIRSFALDSEVSLLVYDGRWWPLSRRCKRITSRTAARCRPRPGVAGRCSSGWRRIRRAWRTHCCDVAWGPTPARGRGRGRFVGSWPEWRCCCSRHTTGCCSRCSKSAQRSGCRRRCRSRLGCSHSGLRAAGCSCWRPRPVWQEASTAHTASANERQAVMGLLKSTGRWSCHSQRGPSRARRDANHDWGNSLKGKKRSPPYLGWLARRLPDKGGPPFSRAAVPSGLLGFRACAPRRAVRDLALPSGARVGARGKPVRIRRGPATVTGRP